MSPEQDRCRDGGGSAEKPTIIYSDMLHPSNCSEITISHIGICNPYVGISPKMQLLLQIILFFALGVSAGIFRIRPLVNGCPQPCRSLGYNPRNWTHVHGTGELNSCQKPLLFDFNIRNDLAEHPTIRTCAVDEDEDFSEASRISSKNITPLRWADIDDNDAAAVTEALNSDPTCGAVGKQVESKLSTGPSNVLSGSEDAVAAASLLANYMSHAAPCGRRLLFAKSGPTIVSVFTGSGVQKSNLEELGEVFK